MDPVVAALQEALPYISAFVGKTLVVKLGGSALGQHDTALQDTVTLQKLGLRPVLVHGGGAAISQWMGKVGQEPRFVRGLRVTDEATLEIVVMVLAGKVNKELVAAIHALGGRALGLSGPDGSLLQARLQDPELGLVGEVTAVNTALLETIAAAGYIPVVAPVALGAEGQLLNLNGDTAAGEIAAALRAEKLIFLTDVPGIADREGGLIPQLTPQEALALVAEGIVSGGMIPKVQACVRALDGVRRAHIIDGRQPHALLRELFTERGVGTMISRAPE